MLEDMTKEELIDEIKKMREELYHLKMAKEFNIPVGAPRPDGYAAPATRPTSEAPAGWALPEDRSGQIPSAQDTGLSALKRSLSPLQPWAGAVTNTPTSQEKIEAAAATITAYKEEAAQEDAREYSGWCLRITDLEGEKFLYLKSPDGRSMSLEVDTRAEVNGFQNRPQVLSQFANVLGTRDIVGVWPRWWKMEDHGAYLVISRHGMSYVITPIGDVQPTLLRDFFKYLCTIRVPSIDEEDGA